MKFFVAFALFSLAVAVDHNKIHWTALTGRASGLTVNRVATPVQYVYAVAQPSVQYVQLQPAVQYVQAAAPVQHVAVAQVAQTAHAHGPIIAAVHSTRNVQVVDGPSAAPAQVQSIVIPPSTQPLDFEFQSQSSPLSVRQNHIPGRAAETQESNHEEPADVLRQRIVKPIVHEIHEAIQPIRKISQEVRPVQETVNQILTRGHAQAAQTEVATVAVQPVQVQAVQPVQVQTLRPVRIARPVKFLTAQVSRPAVVALNTLGSAHTTSVIDGGYITDGNNFETVAQK